MEAARQRGIYKFFTVVKCLKIPAKIAVLLKTWYENAVSPLLIFDQRQFSVPLSDPQGRAFGVRQRVRMVDLDGGTVKLPSLSTELPEPKQAVRLLSGSSKESLPS